MTDAPRTKEFFSSSDIFLLDPEKYFSVAEFCERLEHELNAERNKKRPFSDQLAQQVIEGQVKTIDRLTKEIQELRGLVDAMGTELSNAADQWGGYWPALNAYERLQGAK